MSSVDTPPATTLSTPSPTERSSASQLDSVAPSDPTNTESAPPSNAVMPPLRPIYLIVATSPSLGIGLNGQLPWGALKTDMSFFRRVTQTTTTVSATTASPTITSRNDPSLLPAAQNAVIMGRKTWVSIPPRFRPLARRLNVVVSRDPAPLARAVAAELGWACNPSSSDSDLQAIYHLHRQQHQQQPAAPSATAGSSSPPGEDVLIVSSLDAALRAVLVPAPQQQHQQQSQPATTWPPVANVFIIGGAEIYRAALSLPSSVSVSSSSNSSISSSSSHPPRAPPDSVIIAPRILQTQVRRKDGAEIVCDTHFPLDLTHAAAWQQAPHHEVEQWIGGGTVPGGAGVGTEEEWVGADAKGEYEMRIVGWERRTTTTG